MNRIFTLLGIASILVAGCGAAGSPGAETGPTPDRTVAVRADLAPTGPIRLGFPAAPPFLGQQDPSSGQWKGLAITLGEAMATKLGVGVVPTPYADPGKVYQALLAGDVDVVLAQLQVKPATATGTGAVISLEHSYLVGSGSPLASASDVDRPGIRVGSVQGSPHTAFLASHLQHAQLVQFGSSTEALAALAAGKIDAYADVRFALIGLARLAPGSRVVSGSFFTPGLGLVTLSVHSVGEAFLGSFVASELAAGDVQRAVQAIGMPGLVVGPAA